VIIASLIQGCLLLLLNSWHKNIPKFDKEIHLANADGSFLATFSIIVITVSYKVILYNFYSTKFKVLFKLTFISGQYVIAN